MFPQKSNLRRSVGGKSDSGDAAALDGDGGVLLLVVHVAMLQRRASWAFCNGTFITPIKWETHHPLNSCQAGSKVRPAGLTKNSFFLQRAQIQS